MNFRVKINNNFTSGMNSPYSS